MRKALLTGLFVASASANVSATVQEGDLLVHDGRTLRMEMESAAPGIDVFHQSPLEAYFGASREKPAFDLPDTAHWRGYEATWAITDEHLVLVSITATVGGHPVGLRDIDPAWVEPPVARWFTGVLVAYDEDAGGTRMRIEVDRGRVTRLAVLSRNGG